jgi:hypothetical protein
MSLPVSSFPETHPKLTSKRWFFGGRLNTGGASFMKGIRHIARVQLKSSVARFAPKPSQNLRPTPPPRLSVRASTITIDLIAVPHDDGCQSSTDKRHDASIPDPTSWPRSRAVPLLVSNLRPRGISAGAGGGAASGTVQRPRARANSEAARAARGGATSPSPSWELEIKEMGPVPDLPSVVLTPANAGEPHDSPSGVTHEKKNELFGGDFNLRESETRTLRRTLSSPSIKHAGRRKREQPPPPPSLLPLLSVHIAPMRSGSRPTPSPLLATGPRPWTAPTTHATNPVAQTAPRVPLRRPTGPRSTRDCHGNAGCDCGCSPSSSLSRSRSQPRLRTVATVTDAKSSGVASAAVGQPILSRAGSPAPALALAEVTRDNLQPSPSPAASSAETSEVLQETPPLRAFPWGGDGTRGERRPRTAPETGGAARPLAPVVAMDHWAARERRVAGARQQTTRARLPYGPHPR